MDQLLERVVGLFILVWGFHYDIVGKSLFKRIYMAECTKLKYLDSYALNVTMSLKKHKSCSAKASTIYRVSSSQRKMSSKYFILCIFPNYKLQAGFCTQYLIAAPGVSGLHIAADLQE